jgi:PTS system cellobiose-specific IIA component
MDLEQAIYRLVLHGGNARGKAYEALDAAEEFDFEKAEEHLQEAEEELQKGHKWQTQLIQTMENTPPNFLAIHAQDHLMTALAELNLVKRFVQNYRTIHDLKKRVEELEKRV